uniref:dual specificity protein phosphatase 12 isoform X3 n=1 Tax=Podarcis muralis TaxID=64176 RepID=UPI0010A0657E|nr:dual specificity protein phosphatase 12 isoform X3 [Podarcis muralis]
MVPVLPGLYLGGGGGGLGLPDGAAPAWALLLVDSEPPEAGAVSGAEAVLHVPALDQPQADLLSHLDACADFLGRARERGARALVRCQAGVSRSVAVVTAYLMKANKLPFEEAYAFVQAIKPDAKMNEGFEWQLKLYEKMGCEVDVTSTIYKQYRLQKVTEKYPELRNLPRDVFAVDPNTVQQTPNTEVLYRCRKCRYLSKSFCYLCFWMTGACSFEVQASCLMMKARDLLLLLIRGFRDLPLFTMMTSLGVLLTSLSLCNGWNLHS